MSKSDTLEVERHGRVMLTRFNRPEKLNAMNPETYAAFRGAIEEANADPSIGAIVSTGNGRAYSAGADIGGFNSTFESNGEAARERRQTPFDPEFGISNNGFHFRLQRIEGSLSLVKFG